MNLAKALQILGGDFSECEVARNRNYAIHRNGRGRLSVRFHYSKMYDGGNIWWTSEFPLNLEGCDYLIIALQSRGLLVLPSDVVSLKYWEKLNVPALKSGRRNIRIREDNGRLVLYNRKGQDVVDMTEYLHPCEVDD